MKIQIKQHINILLTALFFIAVWCFWSIFYPFVLGHQEQLQLFLLNGDYFTDRMIVPGGLARYLAEYFMQFGNSALLGGLVVAVVLAIMQLLVWQCGRFGENSYWYSLSFVPSLGAILFMGDENLQFTFVVALIFALLAMSAYTCTKSTLYRSVYIVFVTPVLYWFAGPAVFVFVVYVIIRELAERTNYILPLCVLLLSVACAYVSAMYVPYPMFRIFAGIDFYKIVTDMPLMQWFVMFLTATVPLLIAYLPVLKIRQRTMAAIQILILAVAFFALVPVCFNRSNMDVMEYDYLCRQQKWDAIINKANKRKPDSPLTVSILNLALGMKGQLLEHGFDYYQNGWQGAFPPFNKNYEVSLITAETYYWLGLVNSAQRIDFEAMEAFSDNNKSARLVKRLAETNLINGQYEVAAKYLRMLEQTVFYSKWAQNTMQLLGNEKAINEHPVYGRLRQMRLTTDFLFSEQEIDKVMGQLVMHNPKNVLAIQYLLFLPQLEGNQQKYMMYKNFVEKILNK